MSTDHSEISLPGTDGRSNGLAPEPPARGRRVLVTGGGGYIGCVLCKKLIERGYVVRVLDRLYWGEEPLGEIRDSVELVVADVRELPQRALEGVDGVIHLAGLSNDPTAEYDPEANWQMNALGTESLGRACLENAVERLVFASSCSLYDGLPSGMHDERAAIRPHGAYATSKRYAEEALLGLIDDGLSPGDPPQRHRLRPFPADALRSRRQHLRQGCAPSRAPGAARWGLDVAAARRRARRVGRADRRARGAR